MPEWPKGRDWKSRECPQGVPRVRIPLSPPFSDRLSGVVLPRSIIRTNYARRNRYNVSVEALISPIALSCCTPVPGCTTLQIQSWPIVGVVIRKIECAPGSIIPVIRYWYEGVGYVHFPAHEPVPPVVFHPFFPVQRCPQIYPHSTTFR